MPKFLKFLSQQIRKPYYKTLGTSVVNTNSPMSPPSLGFTTLCNGRFYVNLNTMIPGRSLQFCFLHIEPSYQSPMSHIHHNKVTSLYLSIREVIMNSCKMKKPVERYTSRIQ